MYSGRYSALPLCLQIAGSCRYTRTQLSPYGIRIEDRYAVGLLAVIIADCVNGAIITIIFIRITTSHCCTYVEWKRCSRRTIIIVCYTDECNSLRCQLARAVQQRMRFTIGFVILRPMADLGGTNRKKI